jgi:metal-dependent amidase/aminoacylase/carboxypeptidase family protein
VIPQTVELSGTIRTFQPAVRTRVLARVHEVISGVAGALGCSAEIDIKALTPAVVNDRQVSEVVYSAVVAMAGPQAISTKRSTQDIACFLPSAGPSSSSARPTGRRLDHRIRNAASTLTSRPWSTGRSLQAAGQYLKAPALKGPLNSLFRPRVQFSTHTTPGPDGSASGRQQSC